MTDRELRDALSRIAERAPEVDVPYALYRRGRRAALRTRILTTAAAVACLAVILGLSWQFAGPNEPQFAQNSPGGVRGVPDRIYTPGPDRTDLDLPAYDFGAGPIAVAYVSSYRDLLADEETQWQLVLITATGAYYAITLPDLRDPDMGGAGPVLSPDGMRLAYPYVDNGPAGLAILDLTTGETLRVLPGGERADLRSVQWSPDGRWIAWSGQRLRSSSTSATRYRSRIVAGVIGDGDVALAPLGGTRIWDGLGACVGGGAVQLVDARPGGRLVFSDGTTVERFGSWADLNDSGRRCSAPTGSAPTSAAPGTSTEDGLAPRVLGWLAESIPTDAPVAVVLEPNYLTAAKDSWRTQSLLLVPGNAGSDAVGPIGTVGLSADGLTVATDLMAKDHPTVPAGEDPWASWWKPTWTTWLVWGGGTLLLGLLLGRVLLRRQWRRQLPDRSRGAY